MASLIYLGLFSGLSLFYGKKRSKVFFLFPFPRPQIPMKSCNEVLSMVIPVMEFQVRGHKLDIFLPKKWIDSEAFLKFFWLDGILSRQKQGLFLTNKHFHEWLIFKNTWKKNSYDYESGLQFTVVSPGWKLHNWYCHSVETVSTRILGLDFILKLRTFESLNICSNIW